MNWATTLHVTGPAVSHKKDHVTSFFEHVIEAGWEVTPCMVYMHAWSFVGSFLLVINRSIVTIMLI